MLKKLNPLRWSPLLVLGLLAVLGMSEGLITAEQLGRGLRYGFEFGFESARGFMAGLGLGL